MTSTSPELNPCRAEFSARPARTGARRHRAHRCPDTMVRTLTISRESAAARVVPSSLRASSNAELKARYSQSPSTAQLSHTLAQPSAVQHKRARAAHSLYAPNRVAQPSALAGHQTDYGLRDLASAQKHTRVLSRASTCTLIRRCVRRARRISSTFSLASTSGGATDTRAHLNDQQRASRRAWAPAPPALSRACAHILTLTEAATHQSSRSTAHPRARAHLARAAPSAAHMHTTQL
jgi:hypothetical protein